MQSATKSRATGSLSLAAILIGGLFTNCEFCPDPEPTGAPMPDTPAAGTSHPVPGCADDARFRSFDTLNMPEECDGTDSEGNPVTFGPGEEIEARLPILRKCPDENRAFAANELFQVYWTLCNVSDNLPATLLDYQLSITTIQGGAETPFRTLGFTQPNLARCDCTDQIVAFNSTTDPDPLKQLPPGTYRFRLTGIYEGVVFEQAVVNP